MLSEASTQSPVLGLFTTIRFPKGINNCNASKYVLTTLRKVLQVKVILKCVNCGFSMTNLMVPMVSKSGLERLREVCFCQFVGWTYNCDARKYFLRISWRYRRCLVSLYSDLLMPANEQLRVLTCAEKSVTISAKPKMPMAWPAVWNTSVIL